MTLPPDLKKLILHANYFLRVDASLKFYLELKILVVSSNNISILPDNIFSSQRKLLKLKLSDNKKNIIRTFEAPNASLGQQSFTEDSERNIQEFRRIKKT